MTEISVRPLSGRIDVHIGMDETVTFEVIIRMVLLIFQTKYSIFRHQTEPIVNDDFFVNSIHRKSQVKDQKKKSFKKIFFWF